MANYLIDTMTWSHSRLHAYLDCPYKFYLKYIEGLEEKPMWFSSYGTLIHSILVDCLTGKLAWSDAELAYLTRFASEVASRPPSPAIFQNYFRQGLAYCRDLQPLPGKVLDVERFVHFNVDQYSFIGFVDLIREDENAALCILDHKSRALKPRSTRAKPLKTDLELDEYLRQLYLYAIPVRKMFGKDPDFLEFNCFRTGTLIREPFRQQDFESAQKWAADTIHAIEREKDWSPECDPWKCRHLCGLSMECEYYAMQ